MAKAVKTPKKPAAVRGASAKASAKLVAAESNLQIGAVTPGFSLPATGGKTVLSEMLRGKAFVLYFYPRDATPGCTLEGQDFSRLMPKFKAAGVAVFGLSRDSIAAHEKFKDRQQYKFDLLSDADEVVCQKFGVIKMKNMYGKKVRGIERSTFVIDGEGRLLREWRGVKVAGHAEEVLKFVQGL